MKKSLFILALFLGLGNINAQSDATLEETITWLNSFGEELIEFNNDYSSVNVWFREDGFFLFRYIFAYDDLKNQDYWSEADSIKNVEKIKLYLYDSSGAISIAYLMYKNSYDQIFSNESANIRFKSKKDAERFYKALKHYFSFFPEAKVEFTNEFDVENKF